MKRVQIPALGVLKRGQLWQINRMSLRRLIGEIAPPALSRAARRVWRRFHGLGWHVYNGSWPSFAEVPVSEGATVAGASKWRVLNFSDTAGVHIDLAGMLLPIIAATFSEQITVLDFGGGFAAGLVSLRKYAPLSRFSYVLVETPVVVRSLRMEIEAQPHCSISETIPGALPHPLIVNASSVIQFVSDYRAVLAQLTRLQPEFFIVARLTLTEGQTYARQVLEAPRHIFAQWVFNRADFIAEMRSFGYEQVFAADHDLPIDHGRSPGPSVLASLVFAPVRSGLAVAR